jgi:hypothetical protein
MHVAAVGQASPNAASLGQVVAVLDNRRNNRRKDISVGLTDFCCSLEPSLFVTFFHVFMGL